MPHSYFRTGLYKAPLPLVTGKEAAGTVVASSSPDFKEGDRVGYVADHSYAELTAVPTNKVVKLPDAVTTADAAAALLQGLTALTFVREAAGIKKELGVSEGPWALVHAAAGGTGSLLVQILSVFGAKVIGTAGSADKCEIARKHGAQWVIDNRNEDVAARVKEITSGHGVDVIFDGVGKATFDLDMEIIARKGSLIVFGNAVSHDAVLAGDVVADIRSLGLPDRSTSSDWAPRTSNFSALSWLAILSLRRSGRGIRASSST